MLLAMRGVAAVETVTVTKRDEAALSTTHGAGCTTKEAYLYRFQVLFVDGMKETLKLK